MNTTTDETPATDGQIAARLLELSNRASQIIGTDARVSVYWSLIYSGAKWMVETDRNHAFGTGDTFECAVAAAAKSYAEAKRRDAIEARVRAELEATA